MKLFILGDCDSDYILDIIIYTGADTEIMSDDNLGVSGSVVKTLLDDYKGNDHVFYSDNWYTSPKLYQWLLANKFGACGTVRPNRANFPVFPKKLDRGDRLCLHSNGMMAIACQDKRLVHMLTTIHEDNMVVHRPVRSRSGIDVMKPKAIMDYNKRMLVIDKQDMMIAYVECLCKMLK